jgi:hypothetical protein
LEIHHKDLRDRKEAHHKVTRVELEMVDLRDLQVIIHKDLQDQRDLVEMVETKGLLETRERLVLKDRSHRQDQ